MARRPTRKSGTTPATVAKSIANGEIAPLYLLYGPEDFGLQEILDQIVSAVVEPATRAFNYDVLIASEMDVNDAIGRATAFPMMAKRRLVVIKRIEDLNEAGAREFLPVIARPLESTTLVFTAAKIDARRKFFAELRKAAVAVEFKMPYENEVPAWIERRVKAVGKQIDPKAVHLLALSIGPRPRELANEIEKLSLCARDRDTITPEDVGWIVGASREASVFDFTDAVGQRESGKALAILQRLVEQGDSPVGALALLTRHLGTLRKARWLLDARVPQSQFASKLKVPPFTVSKYADQAALFTDAELWNAMAALLEADDRIKSRSRTPEITLAQAIYRICGGAGALDTPLTLR